MDCIEMQKHSKNGEYWANASHYLYCTEAHGQAYFYENISRDLDSNRYPLDKLVTAYSKSMKAEFVKVSVQKPFLLLAALSNISVDRKYRFKSVAP
jgi:hypothetical protein